MMLIEVRKLNMQKKYSGECEFSYSAPQELVLVPLATFAGDVQVKISYWILEDDSVEVKGSVAYALQGKCSRCLNETSASFRGEIDAYFIPQGGKGEEEDYTYQKGVVDLTACVNDAIMLSMPYVLLCREDCEGIAWQDR